ncbi:uncharacterized protein LOC125212809 isoform X2 [Salvia hispanica]|uniref:uncharacterized protein LOC125212809 isoform X2 n=1 Tax=Salvia hispanica TaxID=49212 RepID=UPI002009ABA7|nr:uncharacterized protein LOC125212809 isoform X2 [Salvia hispanica]
MPTELSNETDHRISFEFDCRSKDECPLRAIPARGSRKVQVSRIMKLKKGTSFRVLVNDRFNGMVLSRDDVLLMRWIAFRQAGSSLFTQGIPETQTNRLFGRWIKDKGIYKDIPLCSQHLVQPSSISSSDVGDPDIKTNHPRSSFRLRRRRKKIKRSYLKRQLRVERGGLTAIRSIPLLPWLVIALLLAVFVRVIIMIQAYLLKYPVFFILCIFPDICFRITKLD